LKCPDTVTDDTRIEQGDRAARADADHARLKASETALRTTYQARTRIHDVCAAADDRLVVVVGPCFHPRCRGAGAGLCEEAESPWRTGWPTIWSVVMRVYLREAAHHGGLEKA